MRHLITLSFVIACLAVAVPAKAEIAYTTPGATYSQDFDSLASTGTNVSWANDSTIAGWNLFRRTNATDTTPVAMTSYNAGDGSVNTGAFYSFGTTGSSERALGGIASGGAAFGSPPSGTVAGWIASNIRNATGQTLSSFTLSFNGEQWRDGGNGTPVAQTMKFEYGFGSTFAGVTTWTAPGGTFDWASPVFTTTGAAVNGNSTGLVTNRGGTITGLNWTDNTTLWLRWIELNDSGNDHGLAIDSLSFSAVPEASTILFGTLVCMTFGVTYCKRKYFGNHTVEA